MRFTHRFAAVAATASAALVLGSALPASAATTDSFNGTINSRPAGAYAANSPYGSKEPTITWVSKTKVKGEVELYDTAADGNGATVVFALHYYNSGGYNFAQKVTEKRNTHGNGTHLLVFPELTDPPSGAVSSQLEVYVCNGKSGSTNKNCGNSQYFRP